jgi:DNA-directed RNA polymerase specialized sigma24 family protein
MYYSDHVLRHLPPTVETLTDLIAEIKSGNQRAYEPIVRSFQDMAVGYGYAALGDWQLAEDAAQEAFITAYCELPSLRDPRTFLGWFRRIVTKQIDRIRRKRPHCVPLDVGPCYRLPAHPPDREQVQRTVGVAVTAAGAALATSSANCTSRASTSALNCRWRTASDLSASWTAAVGVVSGRRGRKAAAVSTSRARLSCRKRVRTRSGAVTTRAWS